MITLKEGEYYELHNDEGYGVRYGEDLIGGVVFLEKLFLMSSGSFPLAVVSVGDSGCYVFRQDMLRPIKTDRERLIELIDSYNLSSGVLADIILDAGFTFKGENL